MSERTLIRLARDPIVDFVCEVRFDSAASHLPLSLAKQFEKQLGDSILDIKRLPAADFPIGVEVPGMEMMYLIKQQIVLSDGYLINIGDRALNVQRSGRYEGWTSTSDRIRSIFSVALASGSVGASNRCSVKYTNVLERPERSDVRDLLAVDLGVGGRRIDSQPLQLRVEFREGEHIDIVNVCNSVTMDGPAGHRVGVLLDIDSIFVGNTNPGIDAVMERVDLVHDQEKRVFSSLLTDAAKREYGAEYA